MPQPEDVAAATGLEQDLPLWTYDWETPTDHWRGQMAFLVKDGEVGGELGPPDGQTEETWQVYFKGTYANGIDAQTTNGYRLVLAPSVDGYLGVAKGPEGEGAFHVWHAVEW